MKIKASNRAIKSKSRTITFAIAFGVFVAYSLFILYFLLFAIILALKPTAQQFILDKMNVKLFTFPTNPTLNNFIGAFEQFKIGTHTYPEMIFHSLWRSIGSTLIGWTCSAMVTYILVFYRNRFTKFIYFLGFFLSTLPLYGAGPAEYKLFTQIGFINNPLILITNITLYGGHFFYMYAFWKGISWEYAEAAYVDGAGEYMVFFKIMFPMAIPSMMALFVMSFISNWNAYEGTLLYMTEYPNLSYALYAYENNTKYNSQLGKPAYFAGLLVSLLPILTLFLVFQNTIMERVYIGGLKG
ncbi:MAG: carbohydrate ABC transporter permease [Clostridia bacterium]|nr:carbohydrate ABC transporter permease [Clostridia bacterium]